MGRAPAGIYVFGPFRLDPDERQLTRDGQLVPITPKAFAVLLTLVQRHGHLVDKADLLESVWPDTAVEEGLAYIDAPDGIDNIWIQPVNGGPRGQLTRFESGSPIEHFEWSRDGARLAIMRETLTSDVVRISGMN